ncbi:GroES-like protein [Cylindrobasidium torrendii FP15055 ss-10]|uniref:GroES-like protein n=1 Tax=Cylindrobasidium torrendii FP15055 ss-10 TaxID=1314674 RepID=A0A0D7B9A5_9AGAR|nr:GroES-like protein [Cylindrobasidium torrendii FP15055 ss-10]
MSSHKQLAIVIPFAKGGLQLKETDKPGKPAPGKILLKIIAAGLNPLDFKMHDLDTLIPSYPAVIGSDYAGVVEDVGEGVTDWKKGDRIMMGSVGGAFQQYAIIENDPFIVRIPDDMSMAAAASIPIAFTTAAIGLFAEGPHGLGLNTSLSWDKPAAGKSAIIISASSSVGQYAIQLLKFLGVTTIVAYASQRHADYLKELGATDFVDRNTVSIAALPNHFFTKFDIVFDAFASYEAMAAGCDLLRNGGGFTTVIPSWDPFPPELAERFAKGSKRVAKIIASYGVDSNTQALGHLVVKNFAELFSKGIVKPNRVEVLPGGLEGVIEGTERHRQGKVSGVKLVALPHGVSE